MYSRIFGELDSVNPNLISIGECCVIGVRSAILTHCPIKGGRAVQICDAVFVGYGAIILPGVSIGNGSVVGAGAVVTKDVPAMTIVGGNPARYIGKVSEENVRLRVELIKQGRSLGKHE